MESENRATFLTERTRHTEDVQDIIGAVPNWLLRRGMGLFAVIFFMVIFLSAFVQYPDIITTQLKIESPNAPKAIIAKVSGKLVKILVKDSQSIKKGQVAGYIESTGDHATILRLLHTLNFLQQQITQGKSPTVQYFNPFISGKLGELQTSYETFYQAFLNYLASTKNGVFIRKKAFLEKDLQDIAKQTGQLQQEKLIQQRNLELASMDYEMHKKLAGQRVETTAELRQQEAKYLAQKSPLIQTESELVTADNNYTGKQKELLELSNQISEDKDKFSQALNSLISQAEDWKNKYVLTAPEDGKIAFAGIIQENQIVTTAQHIFYINPGNEDYFGDMPIPQYNMGKIREGQKVLIKLRSYPFEEYGILTGYIAHIADEPLRDSIFAARVTIKRQERKVNQRRRIHLKQGMMADAEIVTEDASVLQRLLRSLIKSIDNK